MEWMLHVAKNTSVFVCMITWKVQNSTVVFTNGFAAGKQLHGAIEK
jgi:hypothetical protein